MQMTYALFRDGVCVTPTVIAQVHLFISIYCSQVFYHLRNEEIDFIDKKKFLTF